MPESVLQSELDDYVRELKAVKNTVNQDTSEMDNLIKHIESIDVDTLETSSIIKIGEQVLSFKKKYITDTNFDDVDETACWGR